MATRTCNICKIEKPLESEFYRGFRRGKPGFQYGCKSCRRAAYHVRKEAHQGRAQALAKARRRRKTERVQSIRAAQGCADCGENHPGCLDFHHVDPASKGVGVAILLGGNTKWDKLEAEIAKCIVLCANCHRKRHFTERAAEKAARSA